MVACQTRVIAVGGWPGNSSPSQPIWAQTLMKFQGKLNQIYIGNQIPRFGVAQGYIYMHPYLDLILYESCELT